MTVYAETLLVVALLGILFYISIRIRKFKRYLRDSGIQGFGLTLISIGIGLLLTGELGILPEYILSQSALVQIGVSLMLLGAVSVIVDFVLEKLRKKELLGIEEDKKAYLKRIRKGMSLKDAEKKAKELIKSETGKKPRVIATDKEFKTWTIFLKVDSDKYKVVIDTDGDVKNWEKLSELPSYLTGAN